MTKAVLYQTADDARQAAANALNVEWKSVDTGAVTFGALPGTDGTAEDSAKAAIASSLAQVANEWSEGDSPQ